jgi:hypothetical protein
MLDDRRCAHSYSQRPRQRKIPGILRKVDSGAGGKPTRILCCTKNGQSLNGQSTGVTRGLLMMIEKPSSLANIIRSSAAIRCGCKGPDPMLGQLTAASCGTVTRIFLTDCISYFVVLNRRAGNVMSSGKRFYLFAHSLILATISRFVHARFYRDSLLNVARTEVGQYTKPESAWVGQCGLTVGPSC